VAPRLRVENWLRSAPSPFIPLPNPLGSFRHSLPFLVPPSGHWHPPALVSPHRAPRNAERNLRAPRMWSL